MGEPCPDNSCLTTVEDVERMLNKQSDEILSLQQSLRQKQAVIDAIDKNNAAQYSRILTLQHEMSAAKHELGLNIAAQKVERKDLIIQMKGQIDYLIQEIDVVKSILLKNGRHVDLNDYSSRCEEGERIKNDKFRELLLTIKKKHLVEDMQQEHLDSYLEERDISEDENLIPDLEENPEQTPLGTYKHYPSCDNEKHICSAELSPCVNEFKLNHIEKDIDRIYKLLCK